jgi:hypothetical protein
MAMIAWGFILCLSVSFAIYLLHAGGTFLVSAAYPDGKAGRGMVKGIIA